MNHFLIIKNADKDTNFEITNQITDYLHSHGAKTAVVNRTLDEMRSPISVPEGCDCVMVLGGDGSILRTVRALFQKQLPIVGVNLGHLGFLTQTDPENVSLLLERLLRDDVRIEHRMMIEGVVSQQGSISYQDIALNDIVVGRSGLCRIIRLRITVNGELLNVYDADGVVVSTPTGSTAYNLSAGGPVVCPKTNVIVVTPISPHSLSARSVILSERDILRIEVENVRVAAEEAVATFDGQTGCAMAPGDYIEIRRSKEDAPLIRVNDSNFYEVLRDKMK